MMKTLVKNKLLLFGLIGGLAAAITAAVLVFHFLGGEEAYRTVQVYQLEGQTEVEREGQEPITPYENMMLIDQDGVRVFQDSYLYLRMDEDKYLMAEPETYFVLTAQGTAQNSKTVIDLKEGAVVNRITQKLNQDSTYEVHTPTSTMAVRGTSFRICVWIDEEGVTHATLEVIEGSVETHLVYPDGRISRESRIFGPGTTVGIWGNDLTSDYDYVKNKVDYRKMDSESLDFLDIDLNDQEEAPSDEEQETVYYEVTFEAGGRVFGRQSVPEGGQAKEPSLKPTQQGHWEFDFGQAIQKDTTIQWIEE